MWTYYLQEINRNAEELITEEEREKKRIEKRKAKKKVPIMNGIKKVRITLRRNNATYKHVAVKFAKICKVMFHHLCLSNFAEKERKEKIRETERKDKGNIERVMMF